MKKLLAAVLALIMLLPLCACSLFSNESIVNFEDTYTHNDPDGLKYDERKVLINQDLGANIEEAMNAAAYPDTFKYDEAGNIIGIYDYDPATGMSTGWMSTADGSFVEEVLDLGKPDEGALIHIAGSVKIGCVVYGYEQNAVCSYIYAFLSDPADKDNVLAYMENYTGVTMEAESETVLVCKQDEAAIADAFAMMQEYYGQVQNDRSATAYADILKMNYALRNYGVNPIKPYSGAADPEDIEFDEKVVLTSNGSYSFVDASLEKELTTRTDIVYGLEGKTVAHYTYFEFSGKDAADKLMAVASENLFNGERVADTVVMDKLTGQDLQDNISAYIGYNVLSDDSLAGYVENLEGTYFSMQYEG